MKTKHTKHNQNIRYFGHTRYTCAFNELWSFLLLEERHYTITWLMQQPSLLQGKEPVNKMSWLRIGYIHEKIHLKIKRCQPFSANLAAILKTSIPKASGRSRGCMRRLHVVLLRGVLMFRGPFPPYLNANQYIPVKGQNLPHNLSDIVQAMVEKSSVTDERNGSAITEDEAELYDRQIRLWGLDAQKRWSMFLKLYCSVLWLIFCMARHSNL